MTDTFTKHYHYVTRIAKIWNDKENKFENFTDGDKAVYLALLSYQENKNIPYVYVSAEKIGEQIGKTRQNTTTIIGKLRKLGLVSTETRPGKSSIYTVHDIQQFRTEGVNKKHQHTGTNKETSSPAPTIHNREEQNVFSTPAVNTYTPSYEEWVREEEQSGKASWMVDNNKGYEWEDEEPPF